MKVLASFNIKGGVGKTTTSVNLAYLAARHGYRTLLWDLDPQGAASFFLRVRPKVKRGTKLMMGKEDPDAAIRGTDFADFDLLPADFAYRKWDRLLDRETKPTRQLRRLLKPFKQSYDLVLLDCPPGMTLLTEAVFVASDALLVPTIPTPLSFRTLELLRKHLLKQGRDDLPVLPFFSMVDRRRRLHREATAAGDSLPFPVLKTTIPYSSAVEQMGLRRAPLPAFDYNGAPARAYAALWREISGLLDL